jgi:hypothetical protein
MKPLIFADEMLILGVEWKKITFLTGCKALTVSDFGEYFYNLGTTEEKPGMESCAKNWRRWDPHSAVRSSLEPFG